MVGLHKCFYFVVRLYRGKEYGSLDSHRPGLEFISCVTLSRSVDSLFESQPAPLSNGHSISTCVSVYGKDLMPSDMSNAQPGTEHTVPVELGCSFYSDFPLKLDCFNERTLGG